MNNSRRLDKWLFIPVEVKVRELQAKTLLACLAADRGYKVVIGEAHAVRDSLHLLPAGVILEKGVAPAPVETFTKFRRLGNKVVSWCEEGLVFFNDDDYVRRKVSEKELAQVEKFFAWGQYHADVITQRFPSLKERVVVSGNARLDLLRPEYRGIFQQKTEKLRIKYGQFILINTNFSHCNHKKGADGYIDVLRQGGKLNTSEELEFAQGWIAHKRKIFEEFGPMIRAVSNAYPGYKVILRPHPGENHDTWKELFDNESNVQVMHEGAVIPWILASSVVIHNGCTTGIEAALLQHPSIAYMPVVSNLYDQYLPNSVNFQAGSSSNLLQSLDLLLREGKLDNFVNSQDWNKTLDLYISGIQETSACEIILDNVDSIHKDIKSTNRKPWFALNKLSPALYVKLYNFINRLLVGEVSRGTYSLQKFPDLSQSELDALVLELSSVTDGFHSIRSKSLKENVYLLTNH